MNDGCMIRLMDDRGMGGCFKSQSGSCCWSWFRWRKHRAALKLQSCLDLAAIGQTHSDRLLSLSPSSVRVCVPAVPRQRLRRPQEDLHPPAGRSTFSFLVTNV